MTKDPLSLPLTVSLDDHSVVMLIYAQIIASSGLTEDQKAIQELATDFAKNEMLPNMAEWDQNVCINLLIFHYP